MATVGVTALLLCTSGCGGGSSTAPADAGVDASFAACTPQSGTGLQLEEVLRDLERPIFLGSAPGDGRLYVVEQPGRIRIVDASGADSPAFLDISDRVRDLGNEQGLLGLAFDPEYANNGRFFVNYTAESGGGDTVIAQYTRSQSDPDQADLSEKILLTIGQPYSNHNGGMIAFGPDGYLYIGMGDGGSADDPDGNGQDSSTLLGSILRIDVSAGDGSYAIPSDNPFVAGGGRPEAWSIGWRNPWRFSFDSQTGDLYIGDVGQGALEEIDVETAGTAGGANYGWKIMEGSECRGGGDSCNQSGLVTPIAEYDHGGGKCSITGGYVYRGGCMPDLQGTYFYADFCTNQVWTLRYPDASAPVEITSGLGAGDLAGISSFGQDQAGELYILSLDGRVMRIVSRAR